MPVHKLFPAGQLMSAFCSRCLPVLCAIGLVFFLLGLVLQEYACEGLVDLSKDANGLHQQIVHALKRLFTGYVCLSSPMDRSVSSTDGFFFNSSGVFVTTYPCRVVHNDLVPILPGPRGL